MNDFDFDELDKAVSSLAEKTTEEHGLPAVPSRPSPSFPAPVSPTPAPEPSPAALPTAAPAKHPPRLMGDRPQPRRAFMDIKPPQKPLTRVGTTLQPIDKDVAPEPEKPQATPPAAPAPAPEPVAPAPEPEKPAPEPPQPAPAEPPKSDQDIAWPDPLDFHDIESKPVEEPNKEEPVASESPKPATEEPAPASPTPFLSEAKVEKRPLGAYSDYRPSQQPDAANEGDELTPSSDGTFKEPNATQPSAAPLPPAEHQKPAEDEPANDMHHAAMMSIPQQYHSEDKPADSATRPVYDTKEYHPPLLEAAVHERRGGMWVKLFIALLVLAILGAAGYFAYAYVVSR